VALERKTSVAVGLGAIALVYGVYDTVMPTVADVRTADPGNRDAAAAEKAARWTAGGLVVGISLVTRDATVFIMGAIGVIAFSWLYRHANQSNPMLGGVSLPSSRNLVHAADYAPDAGYTPSP
jgi:hypothetical protein